MAANHIHRDKDAHSAKKSYLVSFIDLSVSMGWILLVFLLLLGFIYAICSFAQLHRGHRRRRRRRSKESAEKTAKNKTTMNRKYSFLLEKKDDVSLLQLSIVKKTNKHTNDTRNWMYAKRKNNNCAICMCVVAVNEINWCFRDDDGLFLSRLGIFNELARHFSDHLTMRSSF